MESEEDINHDDSEVREHNIIQDIALQQHDGNITLSDSNQSLDWDNSSILTSLINPINTAFLFPDSMSIISSESEDVFAEVASTSTPISKRVTRSMSQAGNLFEEASPIPFKFSSQNRSRMKFKRRKTRVKFLNEIQTIQDKSAALRRPAKSF